MWYYLILAVQIYCLYHVYKHQNKVYWYFIILLVPGLGSLVYLITQVFSERDVVKVQKDITAIVNPTKKVKDLEQKVIFADTFQNRVNVADAYFEINDIETALEKYQIALTDPSHKSDYYVNSQLIKCFFEKEQYADVIATAAIIKSHPDFEKSTAQFYYGLSLYKVKGFDAAQEILRKVDRRYSNYEERLQLARFFIENDRKEDAITLLESLVEEGANLTKTNKRLHAKTFAEIYALEKEVNS